MEIKCPHCGYKELELTDVLHTILCLGCQKSFTFVPNIKNTNIEKSDIIIEVKGGVACITKCPDNIKVRIVDWDNEQI